MYRAGPSLNHTPTPARPDRSVSVPRPGLHPGGAGLAHRCQPVVWSVWRCLGRAVCAVAVVGRGCMACFADGWRRRLLGLFLCGHFVGLLPLPLAGILTPQIARSRDSVKHCTTAPLKPPLPQRRPRGQVQEVPPVAAHSSVFGSLFLHLHRPRLHLRCLPCTLGGIRRYQAHCSYSRTICSPIQSPSLEQSAAMQSRHGSRTSAAGHNRS